MLNDGPVNKKEPQGPSSPEPTDKGETFATRDRQNFMKNVRLERDEQSGLTHQRECRRLIVKGERATGERVIQKHDDRYAPDSQMIEVALMRVAVLVTNEEVAYFITQKLRRLAVCQSRGEVVFEGWFLTQ